MEQQQLKFPGFPEKPEENYWQYPKICNGWWHLLSGAEQKVLDYILRHTWGYQKNEDSISRKQFQKGIQKKDGEWADKGTGLSQAAITQALKGLEEKGFIFRSGRLGRKMVSNYALRLSKNSNHPPRKTATTMSKNSNPCTIETNTIETSTIVDLATPSVAGKEINDLITLFKNVNPSYDRLFVNKTQRAALERLVKKWGEEKVGNMVNILPQTNPKQFAPTITTPLELENKLGSLVNFLNKEKSNQPKVIKA